MLGRPRTEVEHWFRNDGCFSIPLPEIWLHLKEVLKINTNKFDKPIVTFEERDGCYDLANRLYDSEGVTPTLTASSDLLVIYNENNLINKKGDEVLTKQIKLNKKIKVLSLFSGIGAFEKSLENLGVDVELVGFSEIDKYAIKSFCAIHNVDESLNFGDVSKINKIELPDFDLLVGGSPCQAFSVAGHRKGFEDTRGTLFFQYVETLKHKQPKFFVYENVKGLINHDKGNTLDTIAQSFSEVGYRIDIELLNSKFFNVPQSRDRIYIIGIREDLVENEEWNIDEKRSGVLVNGKRRLKDLGIKSFNFNYPKQESVNIRLRDILDNNVDEKFYINEEKTTKLISQLEENNKFFTDKTCIDPIQMGRGELRVYEDISPTLNSRDYKEPRMIIDGCNMLGRLEMKGNDSLKRVYDPDGMCPTLTTMGGGNTEPKIAIEEPQLEFIGGITDEPNWLKDGKELSRNYKQGYRVYDSEGLSTSITSQGGGIGSYSGLYKVDEKPKYRIRKLTPLECFRLQAFSDEDFQKCVDIGISNSQLYKQAGNSITVTVLERIFEELLNTYI